MPRVSSKVACPLCGTLFVGQWALDNHLKKKHQQCPYCPRSYIRVTMHIRMAHPQWYANPSES